MRVLLSSICLTAFLFSCADRPSYTSVDLAGDQLTLPVQALSDGSPAFYSVMIDGKKINFFIVLMDGRVQSYLDACKECYSKKLGYHHEKGHMVCKACKVRFPLDRLDSGIGGCYPIKLQGTLEEGRYVIRKEALSEATVYF
ncbi:MAG: Fe-S-containing protein [Thermodesulfovibrionales bacterium]